MKYLTNSGLSYFLNKIKAYIANQLNSKASAIHTHTKSDIIDLPNGYVVDSTLDGTSSNAIANSAVSNALDGKSDTGHTHTKSQITDFPTIPTNTNQLTNGAGFITSSGSCNYANSAGYVQGNNNSANAANALLRSGSGRTDSSPEGDTWIFLDELGGSGTPWGFKHNQAANTIGFYGAGTETSSINLSNGHFSGTAERSNSSGYADSAGGVAWDNVSGKPSAFTPYFANNTWYAVGDDAAIGDHNVSGGLGVIALNSTTTRIDLCYKDDASNYKSITYDGTTLYMNGNCDYAASAGSVAWSNVSGRPTAVSQFSNDSGYITTDGAAYPRRVGGVTMNFNWNGQGGQPTWLWGGEDGTNMYVYNPANFSVSYANNSGYTNWLRTSSHSDHLLHIEWDGSYFWTYVTAGDGGYRAVRVERSNSSGWADSAGGVAWTNVSGRPWALSQFTNDSGFITSENALPVGSYIQFAGSQAPAGFLVCNGGAISRTTYSALFAVIGTTYGSGDGWSTFNLPNLTDRFLQGNTTVGAVRNAGLPNITGYIRSPAGSATEQQGAFKTNNLASHVYGSGDLYFWIWSFDASRSSSVYGNSSTVQPPALTCLICIKY